MGSSSPLSGSLTVALDILVAEGLEAATDEGYWVCTQKNKMLSNHSRWDLPNSRRKEIFEDTW